MSSIWEISIEDGVFFRGLGARLVQYVKQRLMQIIVAIFDDLLLCLDSPSGHGTGRSELWTGGVMVESQPRPTTTTIGCHVARARFTLSGVRLASAFGFVLLSTPVLVDGQLESRTEGDENAETFFQLEMLRLFAQEGGQIQSDLFQTGIDILGQRLDTGLIALNEAHGIIVQCGVH